MGFWESISLVFEAMGKLLYIFFGLLIILFKMWFPGAEMITGEDLTDYHTVGEVWQESFSHAAENQEQPDAVFEFQCLEATDKYIKLNIKLVETSDDFKDKDIKIKLSYMYWKKVIDEDGKKYQSDLGETSTALASYEAISVDEEGITLYMYYSFWTKIPAGYVQAKKINQYVGIDTFYIEILPHE